MTACTISSRRFGVSPSVDASERARLPNMPPTSRNDSESPSPARRRKPRRDPWHRQSWAQNADWLCCASRARLVDPAVVAALEPVRAGGRFALTTQITAGAAVRVLVVRTARDGAVAVDDQGAGLRLSQLVIESGDLVVTRLSGAASCSERVCASSSPFFRRCSSSPRIDS